jgi:hypothetical protein
MIYVDREEEEEIEIFSDSVKVSNVTSDSDVMSFEGKLNEGVIESDSSAQEKLFSIID